MAQSINIDFHPDATAKCSNCGSTYTFGSSVKQITLEVCGNCHPFYTGQDTVLDTAGRIEKFQERLSKTKQIQSTQSDGQSKKKKQRKTFQSLQSLSQGEETTNTQAETN